MYRQAACLIIALLCAVPLSVQAQEFRLFDRTVQVHGFASQGFIHTDNNNWLTMNTKGFGSGEFTDFGANVSVPITDKLRIGAQLYDRNLGALGKWHPSLDWAVADYRFTNWLGLRVGKVKTRIGLFNDTQDQDFLRTFALLPQCVYPIDIRDATLSHLGGDVYGDIELGRKWGSLDYTAFAGHRSDSPYSGYAYFLAGAGTPQKSLTSMQYGGDLRWNTPIPGLLVGASRINEYVNVNGVINIPDGSSVSQFPYSIHPPQWINHFYGQYTHGRLEIDSEFHRIYFKFPNATQQTGWGDTRGWYVSGSYGVVKRLHLGAYYSHYTSGIAGVPGGPDSPPDLSKADGYHVFDKVIAARVNLNRYWDVKIEGHFMEGTSWYGAYPDGFYIQVSPNGFARHTNALVIKTGLHF